MQSRKVFKQTIPIKDVPKYEEYHASFFNKLMEINYNYQKKIGNYTYADINNSYWNITDEVIIQNIYIEKSNAEKTKQNGLLNQLINSIKTLKGWKYIFSGLFFNGTDDQTVYHIYFCLSVLEFFESSFVLEVLSAFYSSIWILFEEIQNPKEEFSKLSSADLDLIQKKYNKVWNKKVEILNDFYKRMKQQRGIYDSAKQYFEKKSLKSEMKYFGTICRDTSCFDVLIEYVDTVIDLTEMQLKKVEQRSSNSTIEEVILNNFNNNLLSVIKLKKDGLLAPPS